LEKPFGTIDSFPEFSFKELWKNDGPMAESLPRFGGLYQLGRSAVYWGFKGMGLSRGTCAWFPAFNCGVEVEAAIAAGCDVEFYRVDGNLQIDLDDLRRRLPSRPGPVLVIHYFGFPQECVRSLAELCRETGVPLVEDCAHSLFSRHESVALGDFGPIAAFSLSKTLGLYRGGALKVDLPKFRSWTGRDFDELPHVHAAPETYRIFLKDRIRRVVGPKMTDVYRRVRFGADFQQGPRTQAEANEPSIDFSLQMSDPWTGMAWLSRQIAKKASPVEIVDRRRANYGALSLRLNELQGIRPVFPRLPDGTCPLVFPVWVDNRDQLEDYLQARGIECYVFGKWPHPSAPVGVHPEVDRARRHILGLPLQQRIRMDQIEFLADAVTRFSRNP
jgi:perosamine synthetase